MSAFDENWSVWSYEGPQNDAKWKRGDKHGTSVCICDPRKWADIPEGDEKHECLFTACASSEELSRARGCLAASAPELYRALDDAMTLASEGKLPEPTFLENWAAILKKARGER